MLGFLARCRLRSRRRVFRRFRLARYLERRIRNDANRAVNDDPIAGVQSIADEPVVTVPFAGFHDTFMGLGIVVDHPDEMAFGTLKDGPLRHKDRIRANRARDPGTDKLPRPQAALGVLERGSHEEGTRLGIERGVREIDVPNRGIQGAIRQHNGDFEIVARRKDQLLFLDLVTISEQLISETLKFTHIGSSWYT